jgi:hypothetical protein
MHACAGVFGDSQQRHPQMGAIFMEKSKVWSLSIVAYNTDVQHCVFKLVFSFRWISEIYNQI